VVSGTRHRRRLIVYTGALHRMMRNEPAADESGIIWRTGGNPSPD
jgi:hypothetical protein